jgi:hypothetical protein
MTTIKDLITDVEKFKTDLENFCSEYNFCTDCILGKSGMIHILEDVGSDTFMLEHLSALLNYQSKNRCCLNESATDYFPEDTKDNCIFFIPEQIGGDETNRPDMCLIHGDEFDKNGCIMRKTKNQLLDLLFAPRSEKDKNVSKSLVS